MKTCIALLLLVLSTLAHADALGLRGHAGLWLGEIEGSLAQNSLSFDEVSFERENYHQYAYVFVEHPVPLIPNVRVHYSSIEASRQYDVAAIENIASSRIDLSHLDLTLYYELLDNIVSVDAGLSARKYFGEISLNGFGNSQTADYDHVLPMLYALAEVHFPLTGWSIGVEGSYTEYNDYTVADYSARVRYLLDAVVKVGVDAGYRNMHMQVDKSFGFDFDVAGPFASVAVHF